MNLLRELWDDEDGVILSAEAAVLGTVAVIGVSAGLSSLATSVNQELSEVGGAIRNLDQSYHFPGQVSEHASTTGSIYVQPGNSPVQSTAQKGESSRLRKRRKKRREKAVDSSAAGVPGEGA